MAKISNTEVYWLEESVVASWYPMLKEKYEWDIHNALEKDFRRANILANDKRTAHDCFLKWIVVEFDYEQSVKALYEMLRYHFLDIVSSMSLQHRITQMDMDKVFNKYVTDEMIANMKKYLKEYHDNPNEESLKKLLYNCPLWVEFTARIVTNYLQLKSIYHQRRDHVLDDWQIFCDWIDTLPHSEWITNDSRLFENKKRNQ